jgi:exodeoxyribonuclease VII small subunit
VPAKKRPEGDDRDPVANGDPADGAEATDPGAGAAAGEGLDSLSYEQARDELVDVVRRLEAGGASLEDSLALWERGEALAARCQSWLDGARTRLDAVRADPRADPDGRD